MADATTVERAILEKARATKTPANGSIELTPLCNMNCDMCYVRLSREEMEKKGRLRTAAEWLEIGRQMQSEGVIFLLLTGGEPLTYPDFKEVYLGLKEMGMIITINTNATLIDESWAEFFAKNKPRRINITLYGADEKSYSELCHYPQGFDRAINAIKLLKKYGVDVKLGDSLTKSNKADWEKIMAIGNELDIPVRMDTYMCPATREREKPYNEQSRLSPEEAAELRVKVLRAEMGDDFFRQSAAYNIFKATHTPPGEEVQSGLRCMAGKCSFTINWQGEMRPCVVSTSPAASVVDMGFKKAWEYIVTESEKIRASAKCSACTLRSICNTCAVYALLECGKYDAVPEYICRYTRHTVDMLYEELKSMPIPEQEEYTDDKTV